VVVTGAVEGTPLTGTTANPYTLVPGNNVIQVNLTTETMDWADRYVPAVADFEDTSTRRANGGFMESRATTADPWIREVERAFVPTHFSTDGGNKWRAIKDDKALDKIFTPKNGQLGLLNKGMTLWLTNAEWDKTAKKPKVHLEDAVTAAACTTDGCSSHSTAATTVPNCTIVLAKAAVPATVVKFAVINPRPKHDKVGVNFLPFRDQTGDTAGRWTLTTKGETIPAAGGLPAAAVTRVNRFEITIPTGPKGKLNPAGEEWGKIAANGIAVMEFVGPKAERSVYFVRQAAAPGGAGGATSFTPASRPARIQASGELKEPKAPKFNAKKPTLKFKANTLIKFDAPGINAGAAVSGAPTVRFFSGKGEFTFAKTHNGRTAVIWNAASDKRPASAKSTAIAIAGI
jgi:hypothetical protein